MSNNKAEVEEWLIEGNHCYKLGKYSEALECFEFVLSSDPNHFKGLCGKANTLCSLGKAANAISLYDRALKINPGDSQALGDKGRALFGLGNFGGALKCFDEALKIEQDNPVLWDNKSAVLAKIAQHKEAAACKSKAVELRQKLRVGEWVAEGDEYCKEGSYSDAISFYDEALELEPKNFPALEGKGYAFSGLKKYNEAIKCYDEALKIEPKDAGVLNGKGRALFELARYEEAIQCYDEALKVNSDDPVLLDNKGVVLAKMGKDKEAKDYRDKAAKLEQAMNVRELIAEGRESYAAGDYSVTIECCDEALKIMPESTDARHLKGWALSSLQRYAGAIKCYNEALAIEPRNVSILNSKGEALFDLRKYNEAIKCYDEALKVDSKSIQSLCNRGDALFELSNYGESLKCFVDAINVDKKDDRGFNHLKEKKDILEQSGRETEASDFGAKLDELKRKLDAKVVDHAVVVVTNPQPKEGREEVEEEKKKPQQAAAPSTTTATNTTTMVNPGKSHKPVQGKARSSPPPLPASTAPPAAAAAANKPQKPEENKAPNSPDPAAMELIQAIVDVNVFLQQDASVDTVPSNSSLNPQAYQNFGKLYDSLTPEQQTKIKSIPALLKSIRFMWKIDNSLERREQFKQAILQEYAFLYLAQNSGQAGGEGGSNPEPRNIDEAVDQGFDSLKQLDIEINQLAREAAKARQSGDGARAARLEDELSKKRDRFNSKMSMYSSLSNALHDSSMSSIRNIR